MSPLPFAARVDDARPFHPRLSAANGGAVEVKATPFVWCDPTTIPRRPWVFGHWLLRNTITAVVAPGGIGKSSLMASVVLSLATGRRLLGKDVWGGPKRAWYWNLEDDLDELSRQLHAAALFHAVKPEEVDGRLFVDSAMDGAGLCIADQGLEGFTIREPVVEALTAELIARKMDVLIVDPFVSSHNVDENNNPAIDAVAKRWAKVAKEANCAIVLVHHSRKLHGVKVTTEASRGAVSLTSAARATLVLNRMDDAEANRFGVTEDRERRRLFTVQDDKHNRSPAEDAQWFRLASVSLGNAIPGDPYGDDGDSIGVVTRWTPPDAFENVTVDHLRQVQALVAVGSYKESAQAAEWVGKAVAEVLGLSADKHDKSDRSKINGLLRGWFANRALIVVEERDPVKREPKKFVRVGTPADATAPPAKGGAGQGGASGAQKAPRPTCPPLGAGVGRAVQAGDSQVGRGGGHVAGNPALGSTSRRLSTPIFAPGDDDDADVPGMEGFGDE